MGQSITKLPQTVASRIIYLIIIVSYVKLIAFDLYENIVEIKLETSEVPFENYEDLDKSNFDVYTVESRFENIIPDDQHLRNMINRTHVIDPIMTCFDELIKSKNIICVAHEAFIYRIMEINKNFNKPVIKVAEPSLESGTSLKFFYLFEKASPYADKFGKILRRTQETDLHWMKSLKRGFDTTHIIEEDLEFFDSGIDVKQLIFILFCGYFLAIPVFLGEFIVFKFSQKYHQTYFSFTFPFFFVEN